MSSPQQLNMEQLLCLAHRLGGMNQEPYERKTKAKLRDSRSKNAPPSQLWPKTLQQSKLPNILDAIASIANLEPKCTTAVIIHPAVPSLQVDNNDDLVGLSSESIGTNKVIVYIAQNGPWWKPTEGLPGKDGKPNQDKHLQNKHDNIIRQLTGAWDLLHEIHVTANTRNTITISDETTEKLRSLHTQLLDHILAGCSLQIRSRSIKYSQPVETFVSLMRPILEESSSETPGIEAFRNLVNMADGIIECFKELPSEGLSGKQANKTHDVIKKFRELLWKNLDSWKQASRSATMNGWVDRYNSAHGRWAEKTQARGPSQMPKVEQAERSTQGGVVSNTKMLPKNRKLNISRFYQKIYTLFNHIQSLYKIAFSPEGGKFFGDNLEIQILPIKAREGLEYSFHDEDLRQIVNQNFQPTDHDFSFIESYEKYRKHFTKNDLKDMPNEVNTQSPTLQGSEVVDLSQRNPHCECVLLTHLITNSPFRNLLKWLPYIGVSKLLCQGCWCFFHAYNVTLAEEESEYAVYFKGCHSKVYPGWVRPNGVPPILDKNINDSACEWLSRRIQQILSYGHKKGETYSDSTVASGGD